MVGAFFDMDQTVLCGSSTALWTRYMWQKGDLSLKDLFRFLSMFFRYRIGFLDMEATTRLLITELAGESEAERIAFTRRWFKEQLVHFVAAEAKRRVEAHRRRGHRVALITGSPSYTADVVAGSLGVTSTDVLATRFEVRDGYFTGRMIEPMCLGEGKLVMAQSYARQHGVDLSESYFYTDSIVDLPLLEQVRHPVAVNPDRPLRQMALQRGWPIVRFY